MRPRHVVISLLTVSVLTVAGVAVGAGRDSSLERDRVIRLLDVAGQVRYLDLGQPAQGDFDPSPGDAFFFANQLWRADGSERIGRFVSTCVAMIGTEFKCSGTLMLPNGTVELGATVDFAAGDPIRSAVLGGTQRFRNVGGDLTITPTATEGTSKIVLQLIAID